MPQVKGPGTPLTPEEELEVQIRHDLRNLRLKKKTPAHVYKRCAELRYGKSDGIDDIRRPGCLGPDVLDIVAFTALMRTSSARKVSKIEKLGFPTGLQADFAGPALSTAWNHCYRAISKSDPFLGREYLAEIGRYFYIQDAGLHTGLPLALKDYITAEIPLESKVSLAIGEYLSKGIQQSHKWKSKHANDTLRMYLPLKVKSDCVLQVWVGSTIGRKFFDAQMEPVEALKEMLSDKVFSAVKSSRLYTEGKQKSQTQEEKQEDEKEEEDGEEEEGEELQGPEEGTGEKLIRRGARVIRVLPNGDDFEINIFLDFLKGFAIYRELFS
ncbi:hypothetical protein HDV57DRAFT_488166 [Trichoderma longibrachiatum]